jgi:hypothetical protein
LKIRKLWPCATLHQPFLHKRHLFTFLLDGNHISLSQQVGRPIDLSTVDQNMTVEDQLSGRQKGGSKSCTINDIIQAALQKAKEVFP